MDDPKKQDDDSGVSSYGKALRSAGPLFGSGIQLAAAVVVMFFIGRWLDDKFGSTPWMMIVGIFFGLGAGLYNFMKIVGSVDKQEAEDNSKHEH